MLNLSVANFAGYDNYGLSKVQLARHFKHVAQKHRKKLLMVVCIARSHWRKILHDLNASMKLAL